jgi:5-methylcytosine-specific restriction protein A
MLAGRHIFTMPKYRKPSNKAGLCTFPGCRMLTTTGRCLDHTPMKFASEWTRDSKKFLNSSAWLRARDQKLAETPWCEHCEREDPLRPTPATQVDHIKPRHSHPELKLVMANLQSLCDRHHGIKTASGQ